jgi:hypothetical protein
VDERIAQHRPSEKTRRRAEAAGIDLEALKRSDPERYAMLNAQPLLYAPTVLLSTLGAEVLERFPGYRLFEMLARREGEACLLVFPPLDEDELVQLDTALAQLATREDFAGHYAYYREVNDFRGQRREFGIPLAPEAWGGDEGVMVGPFDDQAEAEAWGHRNVTARGKLVFDSVPHAGKWFLDVFSGELPV